MLNVVNWPEETYCSQKQKRFVKSSAIDLIGVRYAIDARATSSANRHSLNAYLLLQPDPVVRGVHLGHQLPNVRQQSRLSGLVQLRHEAVTRRDGLGEGGRRQRAVDAGGPGTDEASRAAGVWWGTG